MDRKNILALKEIKSRLIDILEDVRSLPIYLEYAEEQATLWFVLQLAEELEATLNKRVS